MELNKVHHLDWLENGLPDKSVQLIIADPPYFEIKGEFDFIWSSFDEYLKDVEEWAKECKRILADNGTLFWYGDDKRIAYAQVIFDEHLSLVNHIVWHKGEDFMGLNKSEGLRSFAPCTERVLMYSNEVDQTGLERIKLDMNNFTNLRNYFKELHEFIGKSKKDMIHKIGQKVDHAFRYSSTQWDLPTPETYNELNESYAIASWSGFREYEDLRREYEDLRREYEDLRRPFSNIYNLNEVMRFNNESAMNTQYTHPTRKPEKLTRALILTCSRPNDLVFVPFAGSGTECAMAAKEGRQFIGFDIEAKYVDMANKRAQTHLSTPTLF
jgi:DNA modification methylase